MKIRKILMSAMSVCLIAGLVSGCGQSSGTQSAAPDNSSEAAPASEASGAPETSDIAWPEKSIEIVVPFSAGGDTDFNARALAKYLTNELGQSVVVTNITGGGSSIAMDEVHNSPADGYRFLVNHAPIHTTKAFGVSEYGYEGFDPVCTFGMGTGEFVTVRSDFPADTMAELVEVCKQNPGKYKFGYSAGATTHYAAVKLQLAGAELNLVSTGNAADRVVGLKGGHLDIICNAMPTIQDYVKTGEFKVIANCASERYPTYPDIQTVKEQGVDFSYDANYTLFAVKGTDPQIIQKLSETINKIIYNNTDYADEISTAYNQVPYYKNTEDTLALLKEQQDEYMAVAEELQKNF